MNTSISFSDRNTLNTMGTPFVFHAVIRTLPFNNKGNIFNASLTSLIDIQNFNLPAPALGITAVHAEEFTREKRSLISASTTLNGDDGIFLIHNIFRQERDFDFLKQLFFIRFQFRRSISSKASSRISGSSLSYISWASAICLSFSTSW